MQKTNERIRETFLCLSSMSQDDWEGAMLAFFDLISQETRETFPLANPNEIYKHVKSAALGLGVYYCRQKGEFIENVIDATLRNWWSVASIHDDTLWDGRPFPRGRKYSPYALVRKNKSWGFPLGLWEWLESHDNQSEIVRIALTEYREKGIEQV